MISASVTLEAEDPKRILDSLKPDMEDTSRFSVKTSTQDGKIVFNFEASDIAALKAALNSYLRLVQVAQGLEVKND